MEKRSNTRVPYEVSAIIKYKRVKIKCQVINLSMNGVLLRTETELPASEKVKIEIFMEGTTSELRINLEGTIVRSANEELAVEFTSVDLDSFIHLKNIIIYNEGDEEKIMSEFYKSVKSKV